MWEESIVAYFKVPPLHLHDRMTKTMKYLIWIAENFPKGNDIIAVLATSLPPTLENTAHDDLMGL
jgi:hypothetical protein